MADTNGNGSAHLHAPKVWATLITNTKYLPGLLTLAHSLKRCGSRYPLIALYTDAFPVHGREALDARGIPRRRVDHLLPSIPRDFPADNKRFYDCWSKLTLFSLVEFERVVLLDSDMLVVKDMDELMDLELDPPSMQGQGDKVFAACHACVCNPLKKEHYPKNWVPANCVYRAQHANPAEAQRKGAPSTAGLSSCNSGLLVANPSRHLYDMILQSIDDPTLVVKYEFPDQDLLSDLFRGRWVALPYVYNALKTMRQKSVHGLIWRNDEVKNLHYILTPKPWDYEPAPEGVAPVGVTHVRDAREAANVQSQRMTPARNASVKTDAKDEDILHAWWWKVNRERKAAEKESGILDGI